MPKLHLTPSGQARNCTAQKGKCRYGKEGIDPEHYSTKEEAQAAYEKQQADNDRTFSKPLSKKDAPEKIPGNFSQTITRSNNKESREQEIRRTTKENIDRINKEYDTHRNNIDKFNNLLENYERIQELMPRAIRAGKTYDFRQTETNIAYHIVKTGVKIRDFEERKGVSENRKSFFDATDNYLQSSEKYRKSLQEEIKEVKRSGLLKTALNNEAKAEKQRRIQELEDELMENEKNRAEVEELRQHELYWS